MIVHGERWIPVSCTFLRSLFVVLLKVHGAGQICDSVLIRRNFIGSQVARCLPTS